MMKMDLQLFSEAAETGAGVSASEHTQAAEQAQESTGAADFQTLISGQYKQQFEDAVGARVRDAIQRRFRNQSDQAAQYAPIMEALGAKYGIDAGNVAEIAKRLNDDDSLYAEEASRQGLPVKTYKQVKQLEAQNRRLEAEKTQSVEEQARRRHFNTLVSQAEQFKQQFPDFDLLREMEQNPRFVRMTAPGIGMSVEEAYFAIHGRDIQRQSMQYAAQQAGKAVADSVRSGASRPMEGGMQSAQQASVAVDPSKFTRQQLAEVARRVRAGERVTFRNG